MALGRQPTERRREAARKSRFSSLIASPFDMGTVGATNPSPNALVLPSAGVIGISFSTGVTAGQVTIETGSGRSLGTPDLAADVIHRLGFFEPGVALTVTGAIAGTATLHYLDDWRRSAAIATGVFT